MKCRRRCRHWQCEIVDRLDQDFWDSVRELAAMRRHVPIERRRYSGVLEALHLDTLERSKRHD